MIERQMIAAIVAAVRADGRPEDADVIEQLAADLEKAERERNEIAGGLHRTEADHRKALDALKQERDVLKRRVTDLVRGMWTQKQRDRTRERRKQLRSLNQLVRTLRLELEVAQSQVITQRIELADARIALEQARHLLAGRPAPTTESGS